MKQAAEKRAKPAFGETDSLASVQDDIAGEAAIDRSSVKMPDVSVSPPDGTLNAARHAPLPDINLRPKSRPVSGIIDASKKPRPKSISLAAPVAAPAAAATPAKPSPPQAKPGDGEDSGSQASACDASDSKSSEPDAADAAANKV